MGVRYLTHHHERNLARIPFPDCEEGGGCADDGFVNDVLYQRIGNGGKLASIGFDGAIFLHALTRPCFIGTTTNIIPNTIEMLIRSVNYTLDLYPITSTFVSYIIRICNFFSRFQVAGEGEKKANVICFFAVDGSAPVPKNRIPSVVDHEKLDLYAAMTVEQKREYHAMIMHIIQSQIQSLDLPFYKLHLHSNWQVAHEERGEGEIELFRFAQTLGIENDYRHVIISSDSDVTAMTILNKNESIVILTPRCNGREAYITNLALISRGLELNYDRLGDYVIWHFLFFGSDYNMGLMNCPTDGKKEIIHNACLEEKGMGNINKMGKLFVRKKIKMGEGEDFNTLKKLLIVEAMIAVAYYASVGNKNLLQTLSPLLYQKFNRKDMKYLISTLSFLDNKV